MLVDVKNILELNEGEYKMFVLDNQIDDISKSPAIIISRQETIKSTKEKPNVGAVCDLINLTKEEKIFLFPIINANKYFSPSIEKIDYSTAKVTVIKQPKHGVLIPVGLDDDWNEIQYQPNKSFTGKETLTLLVEGNGYVVKLHYFLTVTNDRGITAPPCKRFNWKISSNLPEGTSDFTNWQTTATGNTTQITLDTNAAGHGWFIDSTLDQNDEFLPTSNLYVWIAKAGLQQIAKATRRNEF
jgi:hypothetical protein